jgi:hypothetical protein
MTGSSRSIWLLLFVLFAFAPLAAADDEEESEEKIKLSDCPKAVQKTVKKEVGEGKILEIEKETEDDQVVYEVEYIVGDKRWEIEVAPDGKLLSKEREDADDDAEADDGDDHHADADDDEDDDDGDDEEDDD